MKRFTKRCDFNDILNCQNLIDGAEEDANIAQSVGIVRILDYIFQAKNLIILKKSMILRYRRMRYWQQP